MPVPPEFNGDLYAWFNQIVSDLSALNSKLSYFREEWVRLPDGVKGSIKSRTISMIQNQQTKLSELIAEIENIPT